MGRAAACGAARRRRQARREADGARAGVPVLPTGTPDELGYPLLVKAAAGGGGRGMRVVRAADELDEAVEAAQREAAAAFGDDTVFFERYLERPRHVEIQLLADTHGTVRRARRARLLDPAPPSEGPRGVAVDRARPRAARGMSDAAVAFARAIGYESAGTAEFVLDGRDFFFLELNARIQVEHPVTELVAGVDLVRRAAADRARRDARDETSLLGHAVEVRLYAEDPRTFLPQPGTIERLRLPAGIRVDAGVEEGDEIGTSYDPMIAKLIAYGATRDEAYDKLAAALRETEVGGVTTNLPFLRWLVAHPLVRAGRVDDRLPDREPAALRAAAAGARPGVERCVAVEPSRASAPPRPRRRRGGARARPGRRAGVAHRADARHRDQGARRRRATRVSARQPLVVLEAMKMETPLVVALRRDRAAVHVAEGDRVAGGALLVELDE